MAITEILEENSSRDQEPVGSFLIPRFVELDLTTVEGEPLLIRQRFPSDQERAEAQAECDELFLNGHEDDNHRRYKKGLNDKMLGIKNEDVAFYIKVDGLIRTASGQPEYYVEPKLEAS